MADCHDLGDRSGQDDPATGFDVEIEITDPVWIARFDAARARHLRDLDAADRRRRG